MTNVESIFGDSNGNKITYQGTQDVYIFGGDGNDILTGGDGDDEIEGGRDGDKLYGSKGRDLLRGGDGDDELHGQDDDDQLYGQVGDDFLDGGRGNDLLDGGRGNDSLKGGAGQNIYIFGLNYGVDTIVENYNTATDILTFTAGIDPSDITLRRTVSSKDDLHIAINDTHDRVVIEDQFRNGPFGIDQFTFINGTVWSRADIETKLLESTEDDDYLIGYSSDDTLDGGKGNDSLEGGTGQNTYVFGLNYGVDTIVENYNTATDTLVIKEGVGRTGIVFWREDDDLHLAIPNTDDRLIVEDQFRNGPYGIDKIEFFDGATVTRSDISSFSRLEKISEDNILEGDEDDNTLGDAAGNDVLLGDIGDDTYIFKVGYGQDTIEEDYYVWASNDDTVVFGAGLTPDSMEIVRIGDDLVFKVLGTSDRLTIKQQFDYPNESLSIERFHFDNGGLIWTSDNIRSFLLQSTDEDDYLVGYSETREVGLGDNSAETLEGGLGNDTLAGGTGHDTYIFKMGYGQDIIKEEEYVWDSNGDTVVFGAGLTPNSMEIVRIGDDLVFKVLGTNDRLTIKQQFDYPNESLSIERFQFDNGGLIWNSDNIRNFLLQSTDGDDYLVGYSETREVGLGDNSAEILDGGLGNDTLVGGTGDDTYIFKMGYGQDIIKEDYYVWDSNYDTVIFGVGLTPDTMNVVRVGDDLIFEVIGTKNRLTIEDQFSSGEYLSVEEFQFDAGAVVWSKETIKGYLSLGADPIPNPSPTPNPGPDSSIEDVVEEIAEEPITNLVSRGTKGKDKMVGGAGKDKLIGLGGNDKLIGKDGKDRLNGGKGNDRLDGGRGNDKLNGGKGNDRLFGGPGNDKLNGGFGKDRLYGGDGKDQMIGGRDRDVFFLEKGDGKAIIKDFKDGEDRLKFKGMNFGKLDIIQKGRNTVINFGDDQLAILKGISSDIITASDF